LIINIRAMLRGRVSVPPVEAVLYGVMVSAPPVPVVVKPDAVSSLEAGGWTL
jgi:hypothetical protein